MMIDKTKIKPILEGQLGQIVAENLQTNFETLADGVNSGLKGGYLKDLFLTMPEVTFHPEENGGEGFYHLWEKDKDENGNILGLTDVTAEQMALIYSCSAALWNGNAARHDDVRAIIPLAIDPSVQKERYRQVTLHTAFFYCPKMEYLRLSTQDAAVFTGNIAHMFTLDGKLRTIRNIIQHNVSNTPTETFHGCKNLQDLQITTTVSIDLSECPLLSPDSLLYMATKSTPSNKITLNVHPTIYAKLVEGGEWHDSITLKANANISFGDGTKG